LVEIHLVVGRDGSLALNIEPEDAHPAIVAGALEMAKAGRLLMMRPAAPSHGDRTDAIRHVKRRVARENGSNPERGGGRKGDPC